MNISVSPSKLCGQLSAIGSKSFAHRALICAALLNKQSVSLRGITPSEDVSATADCLRALGATVDEGEIFYVAPAKTVAKQATLNCRESGSTLRFMLPIAAALGVEATFVGSERLFARPILPLLEVLQQGGVSVENWHISGKLKAGNYSVKANVSSQFVTGLLFALALAQGTSTLTLVGEKVSRNYVDITLSVLRDFGVFVEETATGYTVIGGSLGKVTSYRVEGDWSNAAFPLVAAAIGGDVTVDNLKVDSCQGDAAIVSVLKKAGANVAVAQNSVRVRSGRLSAFVLDAQQVPDAVPALSVLAAYCDGTSQISGVNRLHQKESDRLQGVLDMLHGAGISAFCQNGVLCIVGGKPKGATFVACNDHRMAMSQTVLALFAEGKSQIIGGECVAKSYPLFYQDIKKLGGDCVALER